MIRVPVEQQQTSRTYRALSDESINDDVLFHAPLIYNALHDPSYDDRRMFMEHRACGPLPLSEGDPPPQVLPRLPGFDFALRKVFLYTRVLCVSEIDLGSQTFGCSFDLHVSWLPRDAPTKDFLPIIRFPEAVSASESLRVSIDCDYRSELVGYRKTVDGRFRSHMDLKMFPFDAQTLMIEMQLGRCKATGRQLLYSDGFRLAHHPSEPNGRRRSEAPREWTKSIST